MIHFFNQKRFFQSSLLFLLLVGSTVWVQADESNSTALFGVEDYQCAADLSSTISPVLETYQTVMYQYTNVDTPSSEQFENAFMLYRYVEDTIRKAYDTSAEITGYNKSLDFVGEELSACREMREGLIAYARTFLSKYISGSTASKTTFEFVDGLKVMNEDLKDMSLLFQSTFPGQFTEMSNGFTCFAHDCLTK